MRHINGKTSKAISANVWQYTWEIEENTWQSWLKKIFKVAGSKINVQKPIALIYINNYQVDGLMVDENFM